MKKFIRALSLLLVCVFCVALLASCAPASDPDKAVSALKDNGYTAAKDATILPAAYKLVTGKSISAVVSGTKIADGKTDTVTIVYFESSKDAKDSFESLSKEADEDKKDESDWVCKQSGSLIYWGTKDGVKAAR